MLQKVNLKDEHPKKRRKKEEFNLGGRTVETDNGRVKREERKRTNCPPFCKIKKGVGGEKRRKKQSEEKDKSNGAERDKGTGQGVKGRRGADF